MKKELKDHPKFLDWVLSTDKQDHTKLYKEYGTIWEIIFELGAEIMKNRRTSYLQSVKVNKNYDKRFGYLIKK